MNIVITGGHTGIGFELTKMLLAAGHHVGLVVKDEARKFAFLEQGFEKASVDFFYADLSIQEDIVLAARDINDKWQCVDGLFNNAGVLLSELYMSAKSNEMHFEVNTLAPLLLTHLLQPGFARSKQPFVINTVTGGLHQRNNLAFDELKHPKQFKGLFGSYLSSKLALLLTMNFWADKHPTIRVLNIDPGALKTKMTDNNDAMPIFLKILRALVFKPANHGAKKLYEGAFSEAFVGETGAYISADKVRKLKMSLEKVEYEKILSNISSSLFLP